MNVLFHFTFLLASTNAGPPSEDSSPNIPAVLKDAFLQRESFSTARFSCRMERIEPGRAPMIRNWEYEIAKNGVHARDHGDDDGIMLRRPTTGEAVLGWAGAAQAAERTWDFVSNESWLHRAGSKHFVVGSHATWMGYEDIRTHGLRAIDVQYRTPRQHLELLEPLFNWKTSRAKSGLITVTSRGSDHSGGTHYEYEWGVDPEKGPALVFARQRLLEASGKCIYDGNLIIGLGQVDGVWWPLRVDLSTSSGTKLNVEFSNLEFNRPYHAKSISPESLNIPRGARVVRSAKRGNFYYAGNGRVLDEVTWQAEKDKHDLTALAKFHADVKAVGLGRFPSWWDARESDCGIAGVADNPDLWELYVRRWALIRSADGGAKGIGPITDEQRTAAQGILDDCRKQAIPIRSRLDKETARIRSELAEARSQLAKADQKSRGDLEKRILDLTNQTAKLELSPEFGRIFDSLKKRLEGVLTAEQIAPVVPVKPPKPPPGPIKYDD